MDTDTHNVNDDTHNNMVVDSSTDYKEEEDANGDESWRLL